MIRYKAAIAGLSMLLVLPTASVQAADPATGVASPGHSTMNLVSQNQQPDGLVVATYASSDGTVKTVGHQGMAMDVNVIPAATDEHGNPHASIEVAMRQTSVSTSKMLPASERNTRSAVQTLIDLGVDPAIAKRDFGAFDSPTGAVPTASLASFAVFGPSASTGSVGLASPSTTVPWDTQCANFSYASGKVTGRGCSTIYWVGANGSDWHFESKYLITGSSNDTSLFPVRLKALGWKLTWNDSHNNVYWWNPGGTVNGTSACGKVTLSAVFLQLQLDLCLDKEIAWGVTGLSSGSEWVGAEVNTDPDSAGGLQDNDNPPAATSTGHFSTLYVSF